MEEFVRSVIQKADLSVLTKRMVRNQYKVHIGKDSLDDTEKNKLNKIVYRLLEDIDNESLKPSENLNNDKTAECNTLQNATEDGPDLLTPSKAKKKIEEESSPIIKNASESEQNQIKSSPRKTGTPSKPCQQKAEIPKKETGNGEAKVCDKPTDEAKNSPIFASKNKRKIDSGNKKSPKLNVSEVLDEVMKSDIESNIESSEGESSTAEDDIKLISNDSGSDEEKNWKPFSPYKPKKSAKNRNSKWCTSRSDDQSDSEIENLSKNGEDEECSPIKVHKKKLGRSAILSTDDDQSPEKGQRSRKSPRKKANRNKVEKDNCESDKDSVSDSDEEYTRPKTSQNQNKKRKDEVSKRGKLSGKSPGKTTNKNSKIKTNTFNSDQDSYSSDSDSDQEYSPVKKTKKSKPKRSDDSSKKSKRTGKTKISQKSSDSDSDLDQIKKRNKLSVTDKSRNSRSLKRKAVMSSEESHDSDCKVSDRENENVPKKRKTSRNSRSLKRKAVMSSEESNDSESKMLDSENENVPKKRKTSSTKKTIPKTDKSRQGYLSSDKELQESSEEDEVPLKPGNSLKSAEKQEEKRGSKEASRQSSDSGASSSDSEEELSLAKIRRSSNSSRNKNNSIGSDDEEIMSKKRRPSPEKSPKLKEKRLSSGDSDGSMSGSSSSDSDEELPLSNIQKSSNTKSKANKKRLSNEHRDGGSDSSSSDSDEELPLATVQKSSHNKSKDDGKSGDDKPRKKAGSNKTKKSPASDEESTHVKNLRKICRAAGIFVNAKRDFLSCKTNNQKVKKLKQILEEAGMKGRPTMKKTVKIRLKKEAAELSKENIIQEDKGRPKRKVNSLFSRNTASPKQMCTPPRKAFCRLKDIVDSEDSD